LGGKPLGRFLATGPARMGFFGPRRVRGAGAWRISKGNPFSARSTTSSDCGPACPFEVGKEPAEVAKPAPQREKPGQFVAESRFYRLAPRPSTPRFLRSWIGGRMIFGPGASGGSDVRLVQYGESQAWRPLFLAVFFDRCSQCARRAARYRWVQARASLYDAYRHGGTGRMAGLGQGPEIAGTAGQGQLLEAKWLPKGRRAEQLTLFYVAP